MGGGFSSTTSTELTSETKITKSEAHVPETSKEQADQSKKPAEEHEDNKEGQEEEEEEGECGFCLFMKGGGCKDAFIAWENCIKEAEDNKEEIVEKCFEVTSTLKKCMEAHADYYEPILSAEKAAEEKAIQELEAEKETQKAANS